MEASLLRAGTLGHIRRYLSNWIRQNRGTVAIEFALLSLPFFTIVLAIIEFSIAYATATMLESATFSAARVITTGQISQSIGSAQAAGEFRDALCANAPVFISACTSGSGGNLTVASEPVTSFATFLSNPTAMNTPFNVGTSGGTVVIRTQYVYTFITPLIGDLLTGGSGQVTFTSIVATQNEPY